MNTKKFLYEDPTGGGDDATLEVPVWVETVPQRLRTYGMNGDAMEFILDGPVDEED